MMAPGGLAEGDVAVVLTHRHPAWHRCRRGIVKRKDTKWRLECADGTDWPLVVDRIPPRKATEEEKRLWDEEIAQRAARKAAAEQALADAEVSSNPARHLDVAASPAAADLTAETADNALADAETSADEAIATGVRDWEGQRIRERLLDAIRVADTLGCVTNERTERAREKLLAIPAAIGLGEAKAKAKFEEFRQMMMSVGPNEWDQAIGAKSCHEFQNFIDARSLFHALDEYIIQTYGRMEDYEAMMTAYLVMRYGYTYEGRYTNMLRRTSGFSPTLTNCFIEMMEHNLPMAVLVALDPDFEDDLNKALVDPFYDPCPRATVEWLISLETLPPSAGASAISKVIDRLIDHDHIINEGLIDEDEEEDWLNNVPKLKARVCSYRVKCHWARLQRLMSPLGKIAIFVNAYYVEVSARPEHTAGRAAIERMNALASKYDGM